MFLTRAQILDADDKTSNLDTVEVPEWGGQVKVRVMSGQERETFETALSKGSDNLRARFATLVLSDEKGQPLFTYQDVVDLGKKSSKALHRVYEAGWKLNALGKEEVKELEKNSEAANSGDTPLPSRPATESSMSTSC